MEDILIITYFVCMLLHSELARSRESLAWLYITYVGVINGSIQYLTTI